MPRRASEWTRLAACLMLTLPVTGCVSAVSTDAVCAGTEAARTDHAASLADDGGPLSVVSGARLIQLLDAGCGYDT
jgi:hypothetical protein